MTVARISVVTVCLNVRDTIRLTLESVARQTFPNVEHVIIDGVSTDGTLDIIREYPIAHLLSEKDSGVYDAMDKGSRAVTGDIVIFLNAGDTFYDDDVCARVAEFFDETKADIVFGNLLPVYLKPTDTHDHTAFTSGEMLDLSYVRNRRFLYNESIHHQATFYRKWVLQKCTYACPSPEATGEYNLLLKAVMKHDAKVKHIPTPISRFALGGISTGNFEVEWARYVRARDILRSLYYPDFDGLRVKNELEFQHASVAKPLTPLERRIAMKHRLKQLPPFKIYNRLAHGLTARLINALIPEIHAAQNLGTAEIEALLAELHAHATHHQLDAMRREQLLLKALGDVNLNINNKIETLATTLVNHNRDLETVRNHLDTQVQVVAHAAQLAAMASDREFAKLSNTMTDLRSGIGRIGLKVLSDAPFNESGFKVFSQWDEDGLIEYITTRCDIPNRTFIEIGVGDYTEANTRFLLSERGWSGTIVEATTRDVEALRASEVYWRYPVNAVVSFVTAETANKVIADAGHKGDIGLLSIDVDGVDYWVWEAITQVSPRIVICEYNGIFGADATVTVPYDPKFDRRTKHFSWLYAGASLAALKALGARKGYTLIGSNIGGNNAFFVRDDVLAASDLKPCPRPYRRPGFRESRNPDGSLSYLDIAESVSLIADLPVYDVEQSKTVKVRDLKLTYA